MHRTDKIGIWFLAISITIMIFLSLTKIQTPKEKAHSDYIVCKLNGKDDHQCREEAGKNADLID